MIKKKSPFCIAIEGKYVNLREITLDDAQFVLDLRCNPQKAKYLNKTEYNINKQIEYIKKYLALDNEWYFIIENKNHKPLGTVRIYDVDDKQYTGGSWIMTNEDTTEEAIEGDFLLKEYAFNQLGFELNNFDVRKENKKVVRYHKICGSKIVNEDTLNYYFKLSKEEFNAKKGFMLNVF